MIISRVGSIVIEPVLKTTKFVRFADYSKYVNKSKEDPLLSTLSEQNNTYRSLLSMFVLLAIVDNIELLKDKIIWLESHISTVLLFGMIILFAFAYRKQTRYISNRVEK